MIGLQAKTATVLVNGEEHEIPVEQVQIGDTVIVKAWEYDSDKRGDVLYKYSPASIEWLKKKGYIKEVASEF